MSQFVQWVALAVTLILVFAALIKLFKVFNSPAGERYIRQQTQGPFVPVAEHPEPSAQVPASPGLPASPKGEP
jgi:hypothetical protein